MKTIYILQIFRGFAAMLVLLAHTQMYVKPDSFLKIFEHGTSGVTFFFILSGFIICYVNYRSIGNGTDQWRFINKRLLRIYPIYWVYTIAALIISYYFYIKTGTPLISHSQFSVADYLKSFSLYPYSKIGDQWPFLPVAWSLSFEMLFYVAFFAMIRWRLKVTLPIVAIWFTAILATFLSGININMNLVMYFFLNSEIIEFFFGCFIAIAFIKKIGDTKRTGIILAGLGLILLIAAWLCTHFKLLGIQSYHRLFTFGIPYAMLIWGAAIIERNSAAHFLKTKLGRFLIYLGDASYTMYLVHYWILTILAMKLAPRIHNDTVLFLVISSVTTCIGLLCYKYIEIPLMAKVKQRLKLTVTPAVNSRPQSTQAANSSLQNFRS